MIKLRVKANFSKHHLDSSILFADKCLHIENEESSIKWPQPRFDEALNYSSAAIVMAVAALESYINQIYESAHDVSGGLLESLANEKKELLVLHWPEVERFPILKKYQIALTIKNGKGMDIGKEPYQSVDALIRLRNGLVHFKPEWDDSLRKHMELEKRLRNYFKPSRLTIHTNLVWFPYKCLGSGAAIWAGSVTRIYVKEFCKQMDIDKCIFDVKKIENSI